MGEQLLGPLTVDQAPYTPSIIILATNSNVGS